jgi:hypothetical protein
MQFFHHYFHWRWWILMKKISPKNYLNDLLWEESCCLIMHCRMEQLVCVCFEFTWWATGRYHYDVLKNCWCSLCKWLLLRQLHIVNFLYPHHTFIIYCVIIPKRRDLKFMKMSLHLTYMQSGGSEREGCAHDVRWRSVGRKLTSTTSVCDIYLTLLI